VIEAVGLTKRFGGRVAVEDVGFAVGGGEVVGFLGPNGAGKTTTIRLLLGLLRPDAGEAVRPSSVGYLPEQVAAYPQMGVAKYLGFLAKLKGVGRASVGDEVERAMAAATVADLAGRPIGRLSKGQRQRVGMAAAFLGAPPAYVLDEPTSGLDPRQIVEARAAIRSLADGEGAAVLLSTHVLAEAAAVCDRVVVIVGGRVVAEERPGEAPDLEARFLRLVGEAGLS
jgi:ABC-2 type transport system ATP-binding protein